MTLYFNAVCSIIIVFCNYSKFSISIIFPFTDEVLDVLKIYLLKKRVKTFKTIPVFCFRKKNEIKNLPS